MLITQVIGLGAAGNKAAIEVVNREVISPKDVLIINSTLQDITNINIDNLDADNIVQLIDPSSDKVRQQQGGCGKEPKVGEDLAIVAIESKVLDLNKFIRPDVQQIIIVTSLEGGTGCGASIVIAEEIKDKFSTKNHPISVAIIGFAGFENDERGMLNTISYFQRLSDDFVIDIISNKKFLRGGNNQLRACELANEEFANKVSILAGNPIRPSEHNIDPRDLLKTVSRYGYSYIEVRELTDKIKNVDHFNSILQSMVDESGSLDTEKSGEVVMSVIINLPSSQQDHIDHSFKVLKNAYGNAFELYEHIQNSDDLKPFIAYIVSGMDLPIDEVMSIHTRYLESKEKNTSKRRNFFDEIDKIDTGNDTGFEYGTQRGNRRRRNSSTKDNFDNY